MADFLTLNITGAWADKVQPGGLRFDASGARDEKPKWVKFGPVGLKIGYGHTEKGIQYLNIFVKHLGRAGFPVGGLLGEDDHSEVATPEQACFKLVAMSESKAGSDGHPATASVAMAIPA